MMYLQRHTDHSQKKLLKPTVIFLILIALFLLVNKSETISSVLSRMFNPLFTSGDIIYKGTSSIRKSFDSSGSDTFKNEEDLLYEIENLKSVLVDNEILERENEELRNILGLRGTIPLLSASVLASSPQLPFDTMLLDKGTEQDIKIGDSVLYSDRSIIGNIVKATRYTSTVALNSYADKVHHGVVERTAESVEIKGLGGGGMHARVPIDFDIKIHDKILTEGLPVYLSATVSSIEEDRMSGFKEIFLSLPADAQKIRVVFIKPTLSDQ